MCLRADPALQLVSQFRQGGGAPGLQQGDALAGDFG